MTEVVFETFDVGLLDKVVRHRGWELEDDNGHVNTRNQTKQEELPEELMAALTEHIGDGMAKVTVGAELGHSKEYGCKAQAFVSISVHCNNDDDTIGEVQGILHEKARAFTNQDLESMIEDRDAWLLRDKGSEPAPDARSPRAASPATKTKARARPPRGGSGGAEAEDRNISRAGISNAERDAKAKTKATPKGTVKPKAGRVQTRRPNYKR